MKIIHVAHAPEGYGISAFLISLIQAQKKIYKDLDLGVVFCTSEGNMQKYEELGIPLYSLGRRSARDPRILLKLYRIFLNYDIVNFHTHSPWAFMAALFTRKRTVFTFHGALGLRRIWLDPIIRFFYRSIIHPYCDRITFASVSSFERYISAIGGRLDTKKVEMFPYGRSLDAVKAAKSRKEMRQELKLGDDFVVGTAARIDREKRLERLIEAFALLASEKKLKLVIAGNGNGEYERYLRDLAKKNGVDNLVYFLGYRNDIFDVLNSLDLFVLPSRSEPFGMALVEAMAMGVPSAVFRDGGGAVDIIGDSGFVVNDPNELANLILSVKKDEDMRNRFSAGARERARKFDIEFTARRLDSIYRQLLDK